MKKTLLIATGTIGGLGAVLSVTPPQLGQTNVIALGNQGVDTQATPAQSTAQATPQSTATKKASKPKASTPAAATPVPKQSAAAASSGSVSGKFTGDSVDIRYGFLQVQITVSNGKITDAQAIKTPDARNDRYTNKAVPVLRAQTIAVNGNNLDNVSGASYTSHGWYASLTSAMVKAGLL
jgi:uncharacterized protein with FMN-binding domain